MKNLLLTIVAFSVLLLIGCQENTLTDPVEVDKISKDQDADVTRTGTINLDRMLDNPYPVMNTHFIIDGVVEYEHTQVYFDPVLDPIPYISLNLSISAEFTYFCTVCIEPKEETLEGFINSETNDEIFVLGDNEIGYILQKAYTIEGREDGMVLLIDFLVRTDGVELHSVGLALPEEIYNKSSTASTGNIVIYPPPRTPKID